MTAHSEQRKDLIRKLWDDGLSASQIANEIGDGMTRSAVLGVIHRLGIQRGTIVARVQPIVRKPSRRVHTPNPEAEPPQPKPSCTEVACVGGVALVDLRDHHCRWPLGDPREIESFRFCGEHHAAGKPYCEGHCDVAYAGTTRRVTMADVVREQVKIDARRAAA